MILDKPKKILIAPNVGLGIFFCGGHEWALEMPDGLMPLVYTNAFMPLVPLLEFEFESVLFLIRRGVIDSGLPEKIVKTFPFDSLLTCALKWDSGAAYWPGLAIGWLERGYPLSQDLIDVLRTLPQKKYLPQKLRQKAFLLTKFKKART